jgi:hypothetical protein
VSTAMRKYFALQHGRPLDAIGHSSTQPHTLLDIITYLFARNIGYSPHHSHPPPPQYPSSLPSGGLLSLTAHSNYLFSLLSPTTHNITTLRGTDNMAANGTPKLGDEEALDKVLESCLARRLPADKVPLIMPPSLMRSGRNSQSSFLHNLPQRSPCQVRHNGQGIRCLLADLLLDEVRLNESLIDPLYPGYLSRALTCQFLSPLEILTSISKAIIDLQPDQEFARYPLLRIVSQAIPVWRPSTPTPQNEITLLWNIEQVLYTFASDDILAQDQFLFIETLDAWIRLLTSPSLRPIFRAEKDKHTGTVGYIELT